MVVAVVAILAWIVVPMWTKESGTSKARSEVSATFAEIQAKEEQYHADNGVYLAEPTACPATTSPTGANSTACFIGGTWAALRIAPPESTAFCSYTVVTGNAGVNPAPPIGALNANPSSSWYYVLATCDMDNNATTNSQYLSSNLDTTIQHVNEGY